MCKASRIALLSECKPEAAAAGVITVITTMNVCNHHMCEHGYFCQVDPTLVELPFSLLSLQWLKSLFKSD